MIEPAKNRESGRLSDWHAIDTAPEGERVLIWTDTRIDADDFRYIHQVCEGEHVIGAQVGRLDDGEWLMELIGKPTHWQPLPVGPSPTPQALPTPSRGTRG